MTNPITAYEFPATDAPTPRKLPDRLAEIKNVRDFGAVGDGETDDHTAIMDAFNWTASANRGTLYFPPGVYYVSAPIDISTPSSFVSILGDMGASTIVGDFADYVIKRYLLGSNALSGGHIVEKMTIVNRHATGGGIRMGVCVGAAIRDCDITANFGIDTDNSDVFGPPGDPGAYWGSLEVVVQNCNLRPYDVLASGSTGLARLADGPTTNCIFKDFDTAVRLFGGQGCMSIGGCYFEHNNIGVANSSGPYPALPNLSSSGALIVSGCHFKNNGIGIAYVSGNSEYCGILIEAVEGSIAGDPQYGIYLPLGGGCEFSGIEIIGQYEQAGFYFGGGESTVSPAVFAGVSSINTSTLDGVAWALPSTAMSVDLLACNVASVWTLLKLPAQNRDITSAIWSNGGIVDVGTLIGGSGYGNGQHFSVPLTGGSGSGATAFVIVSGGAVTQVNVSAATGGADYTVGDVLSASNADLGGSGSGFSVTVVTVTSDVAIVTVTSHNLGTGTANIAVSGVTPSGYNGVFQSATVVGSNSFSYPIADPGGAGSGGSVFFTGQTDRFVPNVFEGYTYNVSDADTATWGAPTVAPFGGGSNHCKLRYTPAAWTVVGK